MKTDEDVIVITYLGSHVEMFGTFVSLMRWMDDEGQNSLHFQFWTQDIDRSSLLCICKATFTISRYIIVFINLNR